MGTVTFVVGAAMVWPLYLMDALPRERATSDVVFSAALAASFAEELSALEALLLEEESDFAAEESVAAEDSSFFALESSVLFFAAEESESACCSAAESESA